MEMQAVPAHVGSLAAMLDARVAHSHVSRACHDRVEALPRSLDILMIACDHNAPLHVDDLGGELEAMPLHLSETAPVLLLHRAFQVQHSRHGFTWEAAEDLDLGNCKACPFGLRAAALHAFVVRDNPKGVCLHVQLVLPPTAATVLDLDDCPPSTTFSQPPLHAVLWGISGAVELDPQPLHAPHAGKAHRQPMLAGVAARVVAPTAPARILVAVDRSVGGLAPLRVFRAGPGFGDRQRQFSRLADALDAVRDGQAPGSRRDAYAIPSAPAHRQGVVFQEELRRTLLHGAAQKRPRLGERPTMDVDFPSPDPSQEAVAEPRVAVRSLCYVDGGAFHHRRHLSADLQVPGPLNEHVASTELDTIDACVPDEGPRHCQRFDVHGGLQLPSLTCRHDAMAAWDATRPTGAAMGCVKDRVHMRLLRRQQAHALLERRRGPAAQVRQERPD
mmetsp:Transcript_68964/g.192035  ORF Transcript_68964/g.192035 Transcript_68964/m.192035 type:complete len:445 (+) Transcript_68964:820-2154(+)